MNGDERGCGCSPMGRATTSSPRPCARRRRAALLAALLLALSGCSLKTYDACRKQAESLGDMDDCMAAAGYSVVPVNATWNPSIGECWDDRYAGKIPMAYCYSQGGMPMAEVDSPYGVIE